MWLFKRHTAALLVLLALTFAPLFVVAQTAISADEVLQTGLETVCIYTDDGALPTYDQVAAPAGFSGLSIANCTQVGATIDVNGGEVEGVKVAFTGDALALNDKKPLLLTFPEPVDLMLRGVEKADTEWLLTYDEMPLQTAIGLKVSQLVGMPWTASYRHVNLMVNDDYWGVYLLMETEKRSAAREQVTDGGLLIDHDQYWWNHKQVMMSYNGCEYTPVWPAVLSDSALEAGRRLVDTLETSISNGTYDRVVNTASLARWLLAHELLGTSGGRPKIYFKRPDATAKLEMGAMFGFQHIMQADDAWSGLHRDIYHFNLLFNGNNKLFLKTFCALWHAEGDALSDSLDAWLAAVAQSAETVALNEAYRLDGERWGTEAQSLTERIEAARRYFAHRREWLNQNIGAPAAYDALEAAESLGLPVVSIETLGGAEPTCDYEERPSGMGIKNRTAVGGRMRLSVDGATLYDSGDYEPERSGLSFKIRGNSTAWLAKKPYKLRLQQKADLIGLLDGKGDSSLVSPLLEDRDWVMLKLNGNFINTMLGLMVNEGVGMQWTPRCRFVNLRINGEYRGFYALIESVKRSRGRLDVGHDGFIVENDQMWWNEDTCFKANDGNRYTFKYPDGDAVSPEHADYARRCINLLDKAIDDGTYDQVADLNSMVAWLLAHDILGSSDPFGSNIFLTKYDQTDTSKIKMGNLWDFDYEMRTPGAWSYEHTMLNNCIRLLYNSNKQYVRRYRQQWESVGRALTGSLVVAIDSFANSSEAQAIQRSLDVDYNTWERRGYDVASLASAARDWFVERQTWMDGAVAQMEQDADTATYVNAGLPILYIKTENYSEPAFTYADSTFFSDPTATVDTLVVASSTTMPGTVLLGDNGGSMRLQVTVGERVEHGKKPYTIIMDRAADLFAEADSLAMPQREWTLLNTPSRLNDLIAWQTGDAVGVVPTPRCRYVNVIVNGDFRGTYLLAEKPEQTDSATLRQIEEMNRTLATVRPQTVVDEQSFARWLITHDLLGTADYRTTQSIYSRTADGLICLGPLWGFTQIMRTPDGYSSCHTQQPQFVSLFGNSDKHFVRIYKEVWNRLKPSILADLLQRIDSFAKSPEAQTLQRSIALDDSRWQTSSASIDTEIERARQWFSERVEWLSRHIDSIDAGIDAADYDSLDIDVVFVSSDTSERAVAFRRNGYTYYYSRADFRAIGDPDSTLRITLSTPKDLFSTGFADDCLLLSNEAQSLNAFIGHAVNQIVGQPWLPKRRLVLLIENGEYRGLRLLSQPLTACIDSLGISREEGFIVEHDNERYADYANNWESGMGEHYHYWLPESPDRPFVWWVKRYARRVEWMQTQAGYADLIDVPSYVRWALAHDLLGTGRTPTSGIFFAKPDTTTETRLWIGPLHGFADIMQTEDTWAAPHESYDYIRRLFNTLDRTFVVEYKSLWATLSDNFYDDICTRLDQFAASDEAAMASRLRDADAPTIAEEVEAAKRWFARRKEWLDSAAATLWVHLTDIENINATDTAPREYDLQGRPVSSQPRGIVVSKGRKVWRK